MAVLLAAATAPRGEPLQAALDEGGGVAMDKLHWISSFETGVAWKTRGILTAFSCAHVKVS
jgi:hypothetical protein